MRATPYLLAALLLLGGCSGETPPDASGGSPDATATASPSPSLAPSEPFPVTDLRLEGPDGATVTLPVYVAATRDARQRGLMGREELPAGTGMVFLFPDQRSGGFWMKDTLIPLSIAFYDDAREVIAILDMEPCREDPCPVYDPGVPYHGAIEVNEGDFARLGVEQGWRVVLPSDLPTPS